MDFENQAIEAILDFCKNTCQDGGITFAKNWKAGRENRKVIGYFPIYVPSELIYAAGALPFNIMVKGYDFSGNKDIEIFYGPRNCSAIKKLTELASNGELSFLDGIFIHNLCSSARSLAYFLKQTLAGKLRVEIIPTPEAIFSKSAINSLVNTYNKVIASLRQITGNKVQEQEIVRSISLYNNIRDLIWKLTKINRKKPQVLSASSLYYIIQSGFYLEPNVYINLLNNILKKLPDSKVSTESKYKIVLETTFCEQIPFELLDEIDKANFYVIDHNTIMGKKWIATNIQTHRRILDSLAKNYLYKIIYFVTLRAKYGPMFKAIIQKLRMLDVKAIIFVTTPACEPASANYEITEKILEEVDIPHLLVKLDKGKLNPQDIKSELTKLSELVQQKSEKK